MTMDVRRTSTPLTRDQKLTVVSVLEAKAHARVSSPDEDNLIGDMIEVAYDSLSGPGGFLNGVCLLTEEWEAFAGSNLWEIELPLRPLVGGTVTGFAAMQTSGAYADVDPGRYAISSHHEGLARLMPAGSMSLGYSGAAHRAAYRIRFSAGFGDAAAVPAPLKMAIKMLVAHYYRSREAFVFDPKVDARSEVGWGLASLCRPYRFALNHS